jgi:hypothetical protein
VTVVAAGDTAVATPEGGLLTAMGETELVTSAHCCGWWHPRLLHLRRTHLGRYVGAAGTRERLTNIPYSRRNVWQRKRTSKVFPFSSFSNSCIISNLGSVGINTNTSGVVRNKNLEIDRLVVCANKNIKVNTTDLTSDDEREEKLEEALNHAGGFLNESLLDAENDHILDLSPISRKKKFNNAKKQRRNLPKKPKTLSKIIIK